MGQTTISAGLTCCSLRACSSAGDDLLECLRRLDRCGPLNAECRHKRLRVSFDGFTDRRPNATHQGYVRVFGEPISHHLGSCLLCIARQPRRWPTQTMLAGELGIERGMKCVHLVPPANDARCVQPVAQQWQDEYVAMRCGFVQVHVSTEYVVRSESAFDECYEPGEVSHRVDQRTHRQTRHNLDCRDAVFPLELVDASIRHESLRQCRHLVRCCGSTQCVIQMRAFRVSPTKRWEPPLVVFRRLQHTANSVLHLQPQQPIVNAHSMAPRRTIRHARAAWMEHWAITTRGPCGPSSRGWNVSNKHGWLTDRPMEECEKYSAPSGCTADDRSWVRRGSRMKARHGTRHPGVESPWSSWGGCRWFGAGRSWWPAAGAHRWPVPAGPPRRPDEWSSASSRQRQSGCVMLVDPCSDFAHPPCGDAHRQLHRFRKRAAG